jgi:hypothetical protein
MSPLLSIMTAAPAADPSAPAEPVRYVDPSIVGPGLIGFIMFLALAVAVFFLWRSMNKQLGRIDFDEEQAPRPVNAPFSASAQDAGADARATTGPDAATKGPGPA